MVAIKALTVLALAGAISAAPTQTVGEALVRREPNRGGWNGRWSWSWGKPHHDGDSSSEPAAQPSAQPSSVPVADQTPADAEPASSPPSSGNYGGSDSTPAAQPSAQPSAAPSSGGSSSGGYMGIVNEWRSKMGLPDLSESDQLQSNAQNTADSSGGQLIHKLNPGSMAQVLAPGNSGNFESVFVGGWLCEVPSLPGLGSSVCNSASQGWDHAGQTGHADILSSKSYSKIGCALGDGIWACDLA